MITNTLVAECEAIFEYFAMFAREAAPHFESPSVVVAEVYHKPAEDPIRLKLDWAGIPAPHSMTEEFAAMKGKLRVLVRSMQIVDLDEFIRKLDDFQFHYLELRDPWKVTIWSYFYTIEGDELLLLDNRKTLIGKYDVEGTNPMEALEKEINRLFKMKMEESFQRASQFLLEGKVLLEIIRFDNLIEYLTSRIESSLFDGIRHEWDRIVKEDTPTEVELALLAYLARLSIEVPLKRKYSSLIPQGSKLSLGKIFGLLQENALFIRERPQIEAKLDELNKLVHAGKSRKSKNDIIAVKDYFRAILKKEGIDVPI